MSHLSEKHNFELVTSNLPNIIYLLYMLICNLAIYTEMQKYVVYCIIVHRKLYLWVPMKTKMVSMKSIFFYILLLKWWVYFLTLNIIFQKFIKTRVSPNQYNYSDMYDRFVISSLIKIYKIFGKEFK